MGSALGEGSRVEEYLRNLLVTRGQLEFLLKPDCLS